MNKPPVHASLFSGIGGFDLSAEWLGFRNAFHCEINPFCNRILKYHFPDAEHYTDITKTDFTPWRGKVDILSGGFPCQLFSVAGQRKGAEDDRYLWPEMLRAIREIQPAWVVGENVAGILTMVQPGEENEMGCSTSLFGESYVDKEIRQQYVVETVCLDLERAGYTVRTFVIPACAVGAPHRRDRVWFVAHRADTGTETLQCGQKDGVHNLWSVTHSYDKRNTSCESGQGAEKIKKNELPLSGERKTGSKRTDGLFGLSQDASNTNSKRFQKFNASTEPNEKVSTFRDYKEKFSRKQWEKFPTQSPVRSRDDGFPVPMDGITFPKWRQESIKAYGNAIVPQVAYEIFQAIINSYE